MNSLMAKEIIGSNYVIDHFDISLNKAQGLGHNDNLAMYKIS